jgi:hypothetical protein
MQNKLAFLVKTLLQEKEEHDHRNSSSLADVPDHFHVLAYYYDQLPFDRRQNVVVMEDDGLLEMQGKGPYSSVPNEAIVAESFWVWTAFCNHR